MQKHKNRRALVLTYVRCCWSERAVNGFLCVYKNFASREFAAALPGTFTRFSRSPFDVPFSSLHARTTHTYIYVYVRRRWQCIFFVHVYRIYVSLSSLRRTNAPAGTDCCRRDRAYTLWGEIVFPVADIGEKYAPL